MLIKTDVLLSQVEIIFDGSFYLTFPIYGRSAKWRKTINDMGGNFPGGNFLGGNFTGGNFLGGNFAGGSLMGGNFPGGNFPRGSFLRTQRLIYKKSILFVCMFVANCQFFHRKSRKFSRFITWTKLFIIPCLNISILPLKLKITRLSYILKVH